MHDFRMFIIGDGGFQLMHPEWGIVDDANYRYWKTKPSLQVDLSLE